MADPTNDLDDLFTTDDSEKDEFADLLSGASSTNSENSESVPDLDVSASSSVSESSPFNTESGVSDVFGSSELGPSSVSLQKEEEEEAPKGKKGKKEKKAKAPKAAKAPKEKKVKEPKVKADIVDKSAARAVWLLGIVLLVGIVLGNVVAFMTAGAACVTFLIIFDILGIIALLVPFMLLSRLHGHALSVFDTFLALAAIFAIVSCMAILAYQAKSYGSQIKAAVVEPVVETLEC